jgi:hypothetical protein
MSAISRGAMEIKEHLRMSLHLLSPLVAWGVLSLVSSQVEDRL